MKLMARDRGFTLLEMMISTAILSIVLLIVGSYLVSANRTVAQSTAHQDDNAAAQRTLDVLEGNIRFACNVAIFGGTLDVKGSDGTCSVPGQPVCAEWSITQGQLTERTSSGLATVATGVSGLTFSTNSSYNGLVTVQFVLRQPQDQSADPAGVSLSETLTARNMAQPVTSGSPLSGCP